MRREMMAVDKLVIGKIFTANKKQPIAEAFLIAEGHIVFVGDEAEARTMIDEHTEVVAYKDGLILPGFTEGHAHVTCATEMLFGVLLLDSMNTVEDYAEAITAYMDTDPQEEIIMGSGYENGVFGIDGPTAELLDQWIPNKPAIFVGSDHHSYWINTKAMEQIGLDEQTQEVPNGVIVRYPGTTKPTGWLKESASLLLDEIKPVMTVEHYKKAILFYQDMALSNGITIVFEPMYDIKKDYEVRCKAYEELASEGKLKIAFRSGYTIDPEDDPDEIIELAKNIRMRMAQNDRFQLNTIKLFVDGVVEGHTAYLLEEYADAPGDFGEPLFTQEQMTRYVIMAMENGFMIHTHAIGDAALEIVLNAYEAGQSAVNMESPRNAITHLQIIAPEQVPRMKELGVIAVVNPYWHIKNPVYFNNLEIPYLGEERAEKEYLLGTLKRAGITMSQASDFPVTYPPETMLSLDIMVNRKRSADDTMPPLGIQEAITVEEALELFTMGGAYQNNEELVRGSIELGKEADFVVLDQDLFQTDASQLYKTKVRETHIQGKKVWGQ